MGRIALVCLALLAAPHLRLEAQDRPDVPPIPSQEQLRPRADLEATLRVTPDRVRADQTPAVTLVLRNTGRDRLLIPPSVSVSVYVRLRAYQASGEEVVPRRGTAFIDRVVLPSSVRTLLVLEPQETREFPLWTAADRSSGYPVGEYHLEATYHNFPDSPRLYDVYEDGASDAWEGALVTPRASLTVLPLDPDVERQLIARVEDPANPQVTQAATVLALGRSRAAVAPLVRRFEIDTSNRVAAAIALADIGDSDGIARLAEVIDGLPPSERYDIQFLLLRELAYVKEALVLQSRGCEALPILLHLQRPGITEYRRAAASLDDQCPSLRPRLLAIVDAAPVAPTTPDQRDLADRASRAEWILQELDRRSTSDPPVQTQASERALDERPVPVDANRLAEYVRTVAEAGSGSTLDEEWSGIALFGTASTFHELREALDSVTDDRRYQVAYALQLLTFTSNDDTRDEHLDGPYWDAWWMAHERLSRQAWALEALNALDAPAPPWQSMTWWSARSDASNALAYLARLADPPRQVLDSAETHRSWRVRIAAARAVAETDLTRGALLQVRELSNRYVAACDEAARTLSQLVQPRRVDCYSPVERERAAEYWIDAVSAAPR